MSKEIVNTMENDVRLPPFVVNERDLAITLSEVTDWSLNKLGILNLHAAGFTGQNVKVGVIDTYCDPTHPDLVGAIVKSINVTNEPYTAPMNGHGTGVGGCVGARRNAVGTLGVAPDCQIVAIKAMRENGSGSLSEIVKGIDAAIAEGCHVINLSLGTSSDDPSMRAAIQRAAAAGIIIVCAAGNDGQVNSVNFPAKYSASIAVAATNQSGNVSVFSSQGEEISLAAPGERVYMPWKNKTWVIASGTSFASPIAAGCIALLLSAGLKVTDEKLDSTCIDINIPGKDTFSGYGLINPTGYITRFGGNPSESRSPSPSGSESPSSSGSLSASESPSESLSSSLSESPSESLSTSASPSAPPPLDTTKVEEAKGKAEDVVRLLGEFLGIQ